MHKAIGASLCLFLVATPFIVLLAGDQKDESVWGVTSQLVDIARRQPGRLGELVGFGHHFSFKKGFHRTSSAVATIPEATVHAAGTALVTLKHASIEGVRKSLQGLETAYLQSRKLLSTLQQQLINLQQGVVTGRAKLLSTRLPTSQDVKAGTKQLGQRGAQAARDFWEWFGPGGRLHPEEFLERYHGHIVIECLLAVVIGYLFIQRSFKSPSKSPKLLSEEEIDDLCEEWQPEPLHSTLQDSTVPLTPPVVTSSIGVKIVANGVSALNMASYNFLGTAGDPKILEACKATVKKYGLGACGPRGFYGTIDIHLEMENRLAAFMGVEEVITYSYDLATVPSVLPAFANAKDLIIMDELVDYSIQNGANLSRAKVVTFKHNDVEDLERVLQTQVAAHEHLKKPLNRRFIVVEGIYKATGELAPLSEITRLKHKYKFRLLVEESLAFGSLGERGRGACEHFGLKPADVDIICASMGNALASVGGFCAGAREMVDHQRISGLGYCFSAALPPYLASAAIGSVNVLEAKGRQLVETVRQNAKYIRKNLAHVEGVEVVGTDRDAVSPVLHIKLAKTESLSQDEALQLLDRAQKEALENSQVLFAVARSSCLDKVRLAPTIRLIVTAEHTSTDLDNAISALQKAVRAVNGRRL